MNYYKHKVYFTSQNGLAVIDSDEVLSKLKRIRKKLTNKLDNMNFLSASVQEAEQSDKILCYGTDRSVFDNSKNMINIICQLNAFEEWIIQSLDEYTKSCKVISKINFNDWCIKYNKEIPKAPSKIVSELYTIEFDKYICDLPLNKLYEYNLLKTEIDVYKKYLEIFESKQSKLEDKLENPKIIKDNKVYSFIPVISEDNIKSLITSLSKQLDKKMNEYNRLTYSYQQECNKKILERKEQYNKKYQEFSNKLIELENEFDVWKTQELNKINELKIQIPSYLTDIYKTIKDFNK